MTRELGATKTIVSFMILSAILLVKLTSSAMPQLDTIELSRSKEFSNAIINAVAGSPSLFSNDKKVASNAEPTSVGLTPQEANTISVIMQTMLPSMFGLFSNITDPAYKAKFKEPCRFDALMDIFKNLPPYFDVIASKYQNKNDLIAYYSMQLASTFLVNNGSLTMACMYNMLSLQSTLFNFSLDLMDNPEKKPELVGLFGIFMKPVMTMLKKNSMMKIIEHVDRYDKNDNESTIPLFHFLNFVYVFLGIFAILSNILLVLLLRRSQTSHLVQFKKQQLPNAINANTLTRKGVSNQTDTLLKNQKKANLDCVNVPTNGTLKSSSTTAIIHKNKRRSRRSKSSSSSSTKYRTIKSNNLRMFWMIRKKYKTRLCFIVIAICHSFYLLVNFMIMSQAGLAAAALKGLSQFNFMCKFAFFMSPPTTVFNIVHQLAIWLLVYIVKQHSAKLRKTRASSPDLYAYEIDYMKGEYENDEKYQSELDEKELTDSSDSDNDEDTVSVSLTNNSNMILMSQSGGLITSTITPSTNSNQQVKFITPEASSSLAVNYNPILNHQRHPFIHYPPPVSQLQSSTLTKNKSKNKQAIPLISNDTLLPLTKQHKQESKFEQICCYLFSHKHKNLLFCILLFVFICIYDSQNFFLYSLSKLEKDGKTIYFCAFNSDYADYYTVLNQYILPTANLCLFSFFPLALCTMQVLFDFCFLVRVKREQMKRYERIKDVIEWPVYGYYFMYMISQFPLGLHQLVDLASGTIKFPFVFPLFIQLKFTSVVWLNVLEMTLMFICYSSDLYIWMLFDKDIRHLAAYWLNKRIFCRTYKQKNNSKSNKCPTNRCGNSSSSGNIDGSCSVASCQSSSENFSSNRSDSSAGDVIRENEIVSVKKENAQRIYKKSKSESKKSPDMDLQIAQKMNSSSTASSSASSSSNLHKKQISPIITSAADHVAATAKATAAISASVSKQADFDTELTTNAKQQTTKSSIKMIDTDNDEIDDILDIDTQVETKLTKLNEDKELDSSTLARAYVDKPPSFNTATRNKPERRQQQPHQYQNNIDFSQINQIN